MNKQTIASWWKNHPQDYKADGTFGRQNVYVGLTPDKLVKKLDFNDECMKQNAYYAQEEGEPLFNNFFDKHNLNGKDVLEIGCGLGAHAQAITEHGANIVAIDLNDTSIQVTKTRLQSKRLYKEPAIDHDITANIENTCYVRKADAESLPFQDNSFDFVWSWGVIHHTPDTQKVIEEVSRVLRPNGKFCFMVYNKHSVVSVFNILLLRGILGGELLHSTVQELYSRYTDGLEFGGNPLAQFFSRAELRNMCNNAGFNVVDQRCFGQKRSITGWLPDTLRRTIEQTISDKTFESLLSRAGMLLYTEAKLSLK